MTGVVAWVTGLPASGKTTLARNVQEALRAQGRDCVVLDGDEVRAALVPTPGYDDGGRSDFYETLARLAALLAREELRVIVAATAHLRAHRERARLLAPRFLEIHVRTPAEECRRRDPKGLYRSAQQGTVSGVPGADVEYEPPLAPDVVADGGTDVAAIRAVVRALAPA